jgi:WD40 repeat protein
VTSSIDGIVKLWNLETGETVYEVDNGTGEAAVFGNINKAATHLVWRDHDSKALYLLNFETGENRLIDELDAAYVQWFFLSNDASLIIAVNTNFEPNIVVWDVETGERTILGEYRHCNRPQPDMARLSADGTTLVIACDTGLDIWRIVEG